MAAASGDTVPADPTADPESPPQNPEDPGTQMPDPDPGSEMSNTDEPAPNQMPDEETAPDAETPAQVSEPPAELSLEGSATRPKLSSSDADFYELLDYLAQAGDLNQTLIADGWNPTDGAGDISTFAPQFEVAQSGGSHSSVQAAIDAADAVGGSERVFIAVAPGNYRELVCVPSSAPPITLYGTGAASSETVIVFDNYSGKSKAAGTDANPCNPSSDSTTYGTSGSATFGSKAEDLHVKNLTISNDTDESAASGGVQAVALLVQGDRSVFDDVRFLGNQDTLSIKSPSSNVVSRMYFKNCYIEGDTDFIFGRGTAVFDGCTIHTLSSRTTSGVVLAPSTDARNPYGILVTDSTFTAQAGTANGSTHLGRAWDESQGDVATYATNVSTGVYPNGQAVIRNSTIGAHINGSAPWRDAATTSRPYSSVDTNVPANRFYEFDNTGP